MITIYGASDDLVEIGGHPDGDEIGCYDEDVLIVIGCGIDGGVAVRMSYVGISNGVESETGFGCWSAQIAQLGEDVAIPWPITIGTKGRRSDDVGYSVLVSIDAPDGVPLTVTKIKV